MKFAKVLSPIAAMALMASSTIVAFADEALTRDEIVQMLWTDIWAESPIGEENPRASYEYKELQEWLNKYYLKDKAMYEKPEKEYVPRHWNNTSEIRKAWFAYRDRNEAHWDYDSESDEYFVEFSEERYDVGYSNGMWNMTAPGGNIVDTFEPHGGQGRVELTEEEIAEDIREMGRQSMEEGAAEAASEASSSQGEPNVRVTGQMAQAQTSAVSEAEPARTAAASSDMAQANASDPKKSLSGYVISGAVGLIIGAVIASLLTKKGRNDDNR